MKVSFLIFLLVSTIIFAQEKHHFFDYFTIENMILGEWELEKTIIVDRDSVYYELLPTSKKSLRIDEKSITVFRDSVKFRRYWRLTENFYYRLSLSAETKKGSVFLCDEELKKKLKKQRASVGYVIEKSDFNQLVLSHIKRSPLAENDFDNYVQFVYKRKQSNKFGFDDFDGMWYHFSDSTIQLNQPFNSPIRFAKTIDTLGVGNYEWMFKLNFSFGFIGNQIACSNQTNTSRKKLDLYINPDGTYSIVQDAVYLKEPKFKFWIDFKNQLIYLLHESISVYHFDFDEEGALILSYDESLTKSLKKIVR